MGFEGEEENVGAGAESDVVNAMMMWILLVPAKREVELMSW